LNCGASGDALAEEGHFEEVFMASRASIAGHPIHPMLVSIPIGLFVFSLVADIAARFGWGEAWPAVALYCMGGGIVGALLAAIFGFVDLMSITDEKVKRIGLSHMAINLVVVTLYVVNFALRWQGQPVDGIPFALSVIAIVLLLVSGWLGGHMVYVHGVAVGSAGAQRAVERRKVQVPVSRERRRTDHGMPVGQF
jgi:uncharacterized membrane protein